MITLKRNTQTYFRVAYPTSVDNLIASGDELDIVITRPNLDGEIITVTVDLYSKDCFNKTILLDGAVDIEAGEYLVQCIYNDGTNVFEIFKDNLLILDGSEYTVNEDGTAVMHNNQDIINHIPMPPDGGGTGVVDSGTGVGDIGAGEYIPPPIEIMGL